MKSIFKTLFRNYFLIGLSLSILAVTSQAAENYSWVQYTPDGLEARVIVENENCPVALLDGVSKVMNIRSKPGDQYPITVCMLKIPKDAKSLTIDHLEIALPQSKPKRILIIGDTGCRLKGKRVQACNDPVAWPFKEGAAKLELLKPDLIIHVGDFHYRESPCPENNFGCAGSPYGDNWAVWQQDFFSPVGKLLSAAPWVMVRGNHEECDRGGRGWARTLDPYAWSADTGCLPLGDAYLVDLGDIAVAVMDVSTADEEAVNEKQAEHYRQQYKKITSAANGKPLMIAQHRPIWAPEATVPKISGDNKTLALAGKSGFADQVWAILSGHHHVLEVLTYEQSLPVQLVTGHGGDDLSSSVPADSSGMDINGVRVKRGIAKTGVFGYSVLEHPSSNGKPYWTFNGYDYSGNLLLKCSLIRREADCN
jgi:hypothetical protein